jgi:hypothetical protein
MCATSSILLGKSAKFQQIKQHLKFIIMARVTIQELENFTQLINDFFGFQKFCLEGRNGFIYFEYADHSCDSLFNSALTNRALLNEMRAFYTGLTFNKKTL